MYAAATSADNEVYFSWTADLPYGKTSSDGRVYITRMTVPSTPSLMQIDGKSDLSSAPAIVESAAFDGFVRNGGIDITETGVVGTLCAKYVPAWMEACNPNPYSGYCPYALAVCEASRETGTLQKHGTPWRIGKQYIPEGTGKAGAYTHYGTGGQTAGYGYLTYAPMTHQ